MDPELSLTRHLAHNTVQCIYLSDQRAFSNTTDGRVAGELSNRIQLLRDE